MHQIRRQWVRPGCKGLERENREYVDRQSVNSKHSPKLKSALVVPYVHIILKEH